MNRIELKKNNIMEYDVFIFDLDGTLYYQKPFRMKMLFVLLWYVLAHPMSIKDLFLIKTYRKVREQWEKYEKEASFRASFETKMSLDERQYAYVAAQKGVAPERVKCAVELFLLEMPLRVLPPYRDEILGGLIKRLKKEKKTVVIYSDYPVENKLKCLGIEADACYTSGDEAIGCMKPDPKGIQVILSEFGCSSADAVMIGDRYEKDGAAAEKSGVDFIIADCSEKERRKLKALWGDD